MAGAKGRSGRKKSPTKVYREALEQLQGDAPQILESLKMLAFGQPIICRYCGKETGVNKVDREAAIYLLDRIYGKPKQQTELDVKGEGIVSPEEQARLLEIARQALRENEEERRLLPAPTSHDSLSTTTDAEAVDVSS